MKLQFYYKLLHFIFISLCIFISDPICQTLKWKTLKGIWDVSCPARVVWESNCSWLTWQPEADSYLKFSSMRGLYLCESLVSDMS